MKTFLNKITDDLRKVLIVSLTIYISGWMVAGWTAAAAKAIIDYQNSSEEEDTPVHMRPIPHPKAKTFKGVTI